MRILLAFVIAAGLLVPIRADAKHTMWYLYRIGAVPPGNPATKVFISAWGTAGACAGVTPPPSRYFHYVCEAHTVNP